MSLVNSPGSPAGLPGGTAVTFPLQIDANRRTATISGVAAVQQLIAELLLTDPGERLTRPQLGCGLAELLFEASSDELRAATQFQVKAALQKWLGDVITVIDVEVRAFGPDLEVAVTYRLAGANGVLTTVVRP